MRRENQADRHIPVPLPPGWVPRLNLIPLAVFHHASRYFCNSIYNTSPIIHQTFINCCCCCWIFSVTHNTIHSIANIFSYTGAKR